MERVDIDLQIARVILRQDEIPLEVVFAVRHHLADDLNEFVTAHDEHAHADEVIGRRAVVHRQIDDLAVLTELHGQRLPPFAVGIARLGDHGDVAAGGDMLVEHGGKVDGAQDRGVRQHDILRVTAVEDRHSGLQRLKLAAVGAGMAGRVRRQEAHAFAELQVPLLAVAEVVHQ